MNDVKPMVECNAQILFDITHGSCMSCGHVLPIDKFEIWWIQLPKRDGKDWYGAFAKCPICNSENCEFLMEDEVN
jgi:hypothetical protein